MWICSALNSWACAYFQWIEFRCWLLLVIAFCILHLHNQTMCIFILKNWTHKMLLVYHVAMQFMFFFFFFFLKKIREKWESLIMFENKEKKCAILFTKTFIGNNRKQLLLTAFVNFLILFFFLVQQKFNWFRHFTCLWAKEHRWSDNALRVPFVSKKKKIEWLQLVCVYVI